MKLTEIYQNKKTVLSFEIFPPKKEEELKNIDRTLEALCEVQPDFISVTFGAGGSANKNKTIELAKKIKEDYHIEPVVHLTFAMTDRKLTNLQDSYRQRALKIFLHCVVTEILIFPKRKILNMRQI